jgi:hypothetical protein
MKHLVSYFRTPSGKFTLMVMVVLALSITSFAQAAEIEIPVDDLFTQVNTWMTALFPIFAIGGGISIAVVILRFVINQVVGAFRGSGG